MRRRKAVALPYLAIAVLSIALAGIAVQSLFAIDDWDGPQSVCWNNCRLRNYDPDLDARLDAGQDEKDKTEVKVQDLHSSDDTTTSDDESYAITAAARPAPLN